jgi:2',3'-cyclic-nucleotide 2'-phosphodiesterase/3'-nucleotidase
MRHLVRFSILLMCGIVAIRGREVKLTVLATTDLHGNLMPYDYFTATEAPRGLAKIATLIRAERSANPNTLLIDCGDTIQGSPLESFYQQHLAAGNLPQVLTHDPMMLAMNALRYDAMAVGNHEFNFGLKNLAKARAAAHFPWLSANTVLTDPAQRDIRPFQPYIVKDVDGVKVAIIGITTPSIPNWEKPENYRGYSFQGAVEALKTAMAELQSKHHPDVVIVASHSGLDRDLVTGKSFGNDLPGENIVYQMASEVSGIDAIVFGHTHLQLPESRIGNVLITQPKNWGMSLAKIDITVEGEAGRWTVKGKRSTLLPVTADVKADAELLSIGAPYHEQTEKYLNTPVTQSTVALSAGRSRIEDTAILDAVQAAQMHYAKADVSFCASFNPRAVIPKGNVTIRQIAALYVYDNELYAIAGNGKMVRDALENAARYFLPCREPECTTGPLLNKAFPGFNYDIAEGVSYQVDLAKPPGQRIQNLTWRGKPLSDEQPLRIAINNYRAAGSAGYGMFTGAKVLWRSYEEIRDLIIRYYSAGNKLPATADGNWRIVPEAAHRELESEAAADLKRSGTQ